MAEWRRPVRWTRIVTVASEASEIVLRTQNLREAAQSAQEVLEIFETAHLADARSRAAVEAAWTFAPGGKHGKTLRDTAWAESRQPAGGPNDPARRS
jgi:hypothetical protein